MPSPNARPSSSKTGTTRTSANSSSPCTRRNRGRWRTCCGRNLMSRINRTRGPQAFLSALLLFIAPAIFAADRYEHPIHAALTWRGGKVTIDHRFGKLALHTTDSAEVNVQGIVRSSDPEFGRQIHFNVSESGGGITIR